MEKKTLVLGASENTSRYSNMAIRRLRAQGHFVVAIGNRKGEVLDVNIDTEQQPLEDIDTVARVEEVYQSQVDKPVESTMSKA